MEDVVVFVVTGGAGFIGSNIVRSLSAESHDSVVVDDFGVNDKWKNLDAQDIGDLVFPDHLPEFLDSSRDQINAVFHMGAISSTQEKNANLVLRTNFKLSCDLWRWCASNRKPFVYASSASTYGSGAQGFSDSMDWPYLESLRPLNLYGWSKHLFDTWVARQIYRGLPSPPCWYGLKFFNVYGPNEHHKQSQRSMVSQVLDKVVYSKRVELFESNSTLYRDGEQKRDFVWVGDCVNVSLWLSETTPKSGLYNVGSGMARTFVDVVSIVSTALKVDVGHNFIKMPQEVSQSYQNFTCADLSKLREVGYEEPFLSLEEGVERYIQDSGTDSLSGSPHGSSPNEKDMLRGQS